MTATLKTVPQKIKPRLPYDPEIPLMGINPREIKAQFTQKLIHECLQDIAHNGWKVETFQMSIKR